MKQHIKLAKSFHYAVQGIHHAFAHNQNMRIHGAAAILVVLASLFFDVNPFEMGILGVMILLVLSAEMVNTALEEMVDLISSEHHKEAKIAKDVGAGMVLLTAMGSVVVGILIFAPYIFRMLHWTH